MLDGETAHTGHEDRFIGTDAATPGRREVTYALTHLSDREVLDRLTALVAADRQTTAALLAHLAEVDARALYLPAACPSMHVYCVRVLHLSEDAAYKRIHAARAARRFPAIFGAVADGRLHLAAVSLLAPHLTEENADELIAAASHRSKAEIALVLAERYPRPDVPTLLQPLPAPPTSVEQLAPGQVAAPPPAKLTPLAPQRFAFQVTLGQPTHDKLLRAQALLRHRVPSGDLDQVLELALDALLAELERKKFAATERPRAAKARAAKADPRRVPSDVKRAVHARDGEQCAFVSEGGERCTERGFLEFDHVVAVARGGQPTVPNTRLLCSAHNQYEADRAFGAAFMQDRRARAEMEADVIAGLRGLGWSAADARLAVAESAHVATTIEDRMRAALAVLHTRSSRPGRRCSEACAPAWQIRSACLGAS